ncbi:MAG TPA: hypothetical protein VJ044_16155 [Candidatus Hodarchaeales archaeon]|nr:hypothetical protein [Candidatus Hodarchaeales archaeon]
MSRKKMETQYTLLGRIFCKWLRWHWLDRKRSWWSGVTKYSVCKRCGNVIAIHVMHTKET